MIDNDFTITEREEPFTLDEVFEFIDDTYITKTDAHELKSRIVDMLQAEKYKILDEYAESLKDSLLNNYRHFLRMDSDGFEWLTTDAVETHIDETLKKFRE